MLQNENMPNLEKSSENEKKRVRAERLGYAGLARQAVPLLEMLFWSYQRALAVAKLEVTPLQLAFLRRGSHILGTRFDVVADWTRASMVQISRAAKDLEKRGLIEILKGKDRRKRLFRRTNKAYRALLTADTAFETDLLVLMQAGPLKYSDRYNRVVRHLRHLNGYFLMDQMGGIVNLRYFWPKRRWPDSYPTSIHQMSQQDRMQWMALSFAYDPDYKAPAGAFPQTSDRDEPPY